MNLKEAFEHLKAEQHRNAQTYSPEEGDGNSEVTMLGFAHNPHNTNPPFCMIELVFFPNEDPAKNCFYAYIKFSELKEHTNTVIRSFNRNTVEELLSCLPAYAANLNYQPYSLNSNSFDGTFQNQVKEVFSSLADYKDADLKCETIKTIEELNKLNK